MGTGPAGAVPRMQVYLKDRHRRQALLRIFICRNGKLTTTMTERRYDRLQAELEAYVQKDIYPFHMPGHKRRQSPAAGLPFETDLTEVEGVDDLHHAQGILRAAMDRTAALFGSRRCWYLVGGSTAGNLAGIRAVAPYGSEVIVARNCHKSVYHAIELGNLKTHWLWPRIDPVFGIPGSITPEAVSEALRKYPASRAVIITSPTYEGVISDIREIARICHQHHFMNSGIPLFVDEAHGAHLGLFEKDFFPESAVHSGADLVVQSAHKTLPSLTQTALLHLCSSLVDPAEVEKQLDVFETSSPSYPLMASLDGCTGLLQAKGPELFARWRKELEHFQAECVSSPLSHFRILRGGTDSLADHPAFFMTDPGKILIHVTGYMPGPSGGAVLAAMLRHGYSIETEMSCGSNVLCMTSCADSHEGYDRLIKALHEIDQYLSAYDHTGISAAGDDPDSDATMHGQGDAGNASLPAPLTIGEAARLAARPIPVDSCEGRIAGEYIYPYPPGIPVIVPGERITKDAIHILQTLSLGGASIRRSSQREEYKDIVCIAP